MPKKAEKQTSVFIGCRIPTELRDRLKIIAAAEHRSLSAVVWMTLQRRAEIER